MYKLMIVLLLPLLMGCSRNWSEREDPKWGPVSVKMDNTLYDYLKYYNCKNKLHIETRMISNNALFYYVRPEHCGSNEAWLINVDELYPYTSPDLD